MAKSDQPTTKEIKLSESPSHTTIHQRLLLNEGTNEVTINVNNKVTKTLKVIYHDFDSKNQLKQIFRMWTELLDVDQIDITDNLVNSIAVQLNNELEWIFSQRNARLNLNTRKTLNQYARGLMESQAGLINPLLAVRPGQLNPIEWTLHSQVKQAVGINHYLIRFTIKDAQLLPVLAFEVPMMLDPVYGTSTHPNTKEKVIQDIAKTAIAILKQKLLRADMSLSGDTIRKLSGHSLVVANELPGILAGMRFLFFESNDFSFEQPLSAPNGTYYQGIISRVTDDRIFVEFSQPLADQEQFREQAQYAVIR